ncbi:MAG TPA: hypothetical protein VFS00_00280, partial [Polyangiaceae bacterium]|nr:hypothetical protein [Polyangiaceae bacterium]
MRSTHTDAEGGRHLERPRTAEAAVVQPLRDDAVEPDAVRGEQRPDAPGVAVRARVHPEFVAFGTQRDQEGAGAPPQRLAEGHPRADRRLGGEGPAAWQQRVAEVEGDAHRVFARRPVGRILPARGRTWARRPER